jgi:hypothetical protein
VSPRPPVSTEKLRALRQFAPNPPAADWHAIPDSAVPAPTSRLVGKKVLLIGLAGAVALALCLLGWSFWRQFEQVKRELDQTKLALTAANGEVARVQGDFASASVVHDLWGLGSRFAAESARACTADDDRKSVRTATALSIQMWSDSAIRSEIDLEHALLPVLRGLEKQELHVAGASLPAGVVAQYRRFRRDALGDVIMLDPSRIVDRESRRAVLDLLRRAGEGQLDREKTTVVYRFDDYGKVSYPLVQGPADTTLLHTKLSSDPLAGPATIAVAEFPCS